MTTRLRDLRGPPEQEILKFQIVSGTASSVSAEVQACLDLGWELSGDIRVSADGTCFQALTVPNPDWEGLQSEDESEEEEDSSSSEEELVAPPVMDARKAKKMIELKKKLDRIKAEKRAEKK